MVNITINCPLDKTINFEITADPTDTVQILKQKVRVNIDSKYPGITEAAIRLIYKASILTDKQTVSGLRIIDGSIIQLNVRKNYQSLSAGVGSPIHSESPKINKEVIKDEVNLEKPDNPNKTPIENQKKIEEEEKPKPQMNQFNSMFGGQVPDMDPEAIGEMLNNNPMMKQLFQEILEDPEIMEIMFEANPAFSKIFDEHPELKDQMKNPETLSMISKAMTDPEELKNLLKANDNAIANISMIPGANNLLKKVNREVADMIDTYNDNGADDDLFGEKSVDQRKKVNPAEARQEMLQKVMGGMSQETNKKLMDKLNEKIMSKLFGGDISKLLGPLDLGIFGENTLGKNNDDRMSSINEMMKNILGNNNNFNLFDLSNMSNPFSNLIGNNSKKTNTNDDQFYSDDLPLSYSYIIKEAAGELIGLQNQQTLSTQQSTNNNLNNNNGMNFGSLPNFGNLPGPRDMESMRAMMQDPMFRSVMENVIENPTAFSQMFNNPMIERMMEGNPMFSLLKSNPEMVRLQMKEMLKNFNNGNNGHTPTNNNPAQAAVQQQVHNDRLTQDELKTIYSNQLTSLRDMQLCDNSNESEILRLLETYNGDINEVISVLLGN